jgi:hypothetical protein
VTLRDLLAEEVVARRQTITITEDRRWRSKLASWRSKLTSYKLWRSKLARERVKPAKGGTD